MFVLTREKDALERVPPYIGREDGRACSRELTYVLVPTGERENFYGQVC
jgi:hypothetical protein